MRHQKNILLHKQFNKLILNNNFRNYFIRSHNTLIDQGAYNDIIKLRPYQEQAINSVLNALNRTVDLKTRLGVSSPTGSGKTTMFVELAKRIERQSNKGNKVLVIVNGIELAKQAQEAFMRSWNNSIIEIDQGNNFASGEADVTIATFQTLIRPGRLNKYNPNDFKLILIDEAHHAVAKSYISILKYFDESIDDENYQNHSSKIPIIGFSATLSRFDNLALGKVFEEIVFHKDFLDMIQEKWLSNVSFTTIKTDINLSNVKISSRTNDYVVNSLSPILNTPSIRRVILAAYLERCTDRRSTLIFCTDLNHVHNLTVDFRDAGIDARFIHSGTPAKERDRILEDFKTYKFPVLLNCGTYLLVLGYASFHNTKDIIAVLTEGADIPNIDCVMLCRPTRSRNLFCQMIGRGIVKSLLFY